MKSPAFAISAVVIGLCLAPVITQVSTGQTHCSATITDILINNTLPVALHRFQIDNGRYPTTNEGLQSLLTPPAGLEDFWKGPYLKKMVLDPWNTPFVYKSPSSRLGIHYDIISLGPDRVPSHDDLMNEK